MNLGDRMVDRLVSVISLPTKRARVYDREEWRELESRLGCDLPSDLRDFNVAYGAGFIGSCEIGVLVPSPSGLLSFVATNKNAKAVLEALRARGEVPPGVSIFPEPGGLLAWAESGNGDLWFWETIGAPADWTVSVLPRDPIWSETLFRFDLTMSDYLIELCSGTLNDDFSADIVVDEPPPVSYRAAPFLPSA